jgi:hypothetical protein
MGRLRVQAAQFETGGLLRSVSAVAAKAVVQTDSDRVNFQIDVGNPSPRQGAIVGDKGGGIGLVVEIHVEILALEQPIPAERDFEPGADGPPAVGLRPPRARAEPR